MKSKNEFFPPRFPAVSQQWANLMHPDLEAYHKMRDALDAMRVHPRYMRLSQWYRREQVMMEQLKFERMECATELGARSFMREMVDGAMQLGVSPRSMLSAVARVHCETQIEFRAAQRAAQTTTEFTTGDETTEKTRQTYLNALSRLTHRGFISKEARECCDWLESWIQSAHRQQLDGMTMCYADRQAFDSVFNQGAASPAIAANELELLGHRLAVIQAEYDRRAGTYNEINDRMKRISRRILDPYEEAATSPSRSCWLVTLLLDAMAAEADVALRPVESEEPVYAMMLRPRFAENLENATIDPLFWYAGLASLLHSSGAINGAGPTPGTVELLTELLRHPTRLRAVSVSNDGMRTRSVLVKWIAPILKGQPGNAETAAEVLGLGAGRWDEALIVLCNHLATASGQPDGTIGYRNVAHRRTAEFLWTHVIGPHHAEILHWIAEGAKAAVTGDAVPDAATTAPAEVPELTESLPTEPPEADEPANTGLAETWYYATNPEAAMLNLKPVTMPSDGRGTAFSEFLRSQGMPTLIKPSSILHALEYFRDLPPITRAVTPYDDMGTQRWHKIKRGALRIYARIEPDGRLLFHVMARRDWRADLIAYA